MASSLSPSGNSTTPVESASTTAQKRRSLQPAERSSVTDAYADLTGSRGREDGGEMNGLRGGYDNGSKHRTQYYEEQFQYKDNSTSAARDRVQRDSPIVAELKTNVIIKDEFTLVTDLSYHLAARYNRPDSSIMISVEHSSCLALAGTFEPCYVLTISTLPSQMQPTTNKRNAALIQSFMADVLSVPPERGILKFVPIPEENLAINGSTMLGEIERNEKNHGEDRKGVLKEAFANGKKSTSQKKSHQELEAPAAKSIANGPTIPMAKRLSQQERRSSSYQEESQSGSPPVFELPTTEHATPAEKERPSTSHGHTNYAAANGLRLNGISQEDLLAQSSRTANGRPRTIGADPDGTPSRTYSSRSTSKRRSYTPEPMPPPPLNVSASKTPPPPNANRYSSHTTPPSPKPTSNENRKSNIPSSPRPIISPPIPIYSTPDNTQRPTSTTTRHSSHHSSTAPQPRRQHADLPTSSRPSPGAAAAMASRERERNSAAKSNSGVSDANTARRRSGLSATPRLPSVGSAGSGAAPPPPPIPESRSNSAPKVSKRKSFFGAFKR